MSNWRTISKIAVIFGIVFIIFAAFSAFLTYQALILQYSSLVPASFIQVSILSAMLPFMLFAVLSFVVAALGSRAVKETTDKENQSPTQVAPAELTA
jgi:membrane protein implicated in regulation of membrane protease activity